MHCNCSKMETVVDAPKFRAEFLKVLRSRRSEEQIKYCAQGKRIIAILMWDERGQNHLPDFLKSLRSLLWIRCLKEVTVKFNCLKTAMESCPRENIENLKDPLKEENLYLITEATEQGRLPVLILSTKESNNQRKPAIVFLHHTLSCKEWLRPLLEAYATRGYIAVAIDSRYPGERANNTSTYQDALVLSWKNGDTMPFIFDTVWDLIKLADYLSERVDVDPYRIRITGLSLGGMHAWFAAAVDTRYAVVVPVIGVQGFRWAIDNDKWQARVDSIKFVFEEARVDLGKEEIDKEVVEKVWDRIAPGLASQFDSPYTIPVITPRPLLILNGAEDPRCPIEGLEIPISRANEVYREANCSENFKVILQSGIAHETTPLMLKETSDWFDRFL